MCFDFVFFFKQKTAYEMRISDWSSDVCSSDLVPSLTRLIAGVDFLGNQQAKNRIQRFLIFFGFVPAKVESEKQATGRSEEHTSELQSLMRISYAVFCLKKKKTKTNTPITVSSQLYKCTITNTSNRLDQRHTHIEA